jgi:hypothetical protein
VSLIHERQTSSIKMKAENQTPAFMKNKERNTGEKVQT